MRMKQRVHASIRRLNLQEIFMNRISITAEKERFISEREIIERYGISHTSLWRWVRDGRFPKGEFLGPNTKRWPLSKLLEWEKEAKAGAAA